MAPSSSILNKHSTSVVNNATGGTTSTVAHLAPLAAAAFKDDPFILHAFCHKANQDEHGKVLQDTFQVTMQDVLSRPDRRVLHMDDSGRCFAAWSLMGKEPNEIGRMFRVVTGFIKKIGFRRTFRMAPLFDALRKAHATKPHVYLIIFATHPDAQGQGLGSSVMRKMTQYLDEHQLPAYTESSNPRNVPFYQRHGFKIVEQPISTLPKGTPTCTSLWREPKVVN